MMVKENNRKVKHQKKHDVNYGFWLRPTLFLPARSNQVTRKVKRPPLNSNPSLLTCHFTGSKLCLYTLECTGILFVTLYTSFHSKTRKRDACHINSRTVIDISRQPIGTTLGGREKQFERMNYRHRNK